MLVLEEICIPTENIFIVQPQVVAYWEKDCLGQGTLYLTLRTVVWISNLNRKGFYLTYPAISIHAISNSNEEFTDPCLLVVINIKKTDINYTPDVDVDDEDDEFDHMSVTIRFIPADPLSVSLLYEKMNECQAQNPEPDDEMNDLNEDEEGEFDDEIIAGNGHESSNQWYTAENLSDEVELSAEGRATLERLLGNLSDIPDESRELNNSSNGHNNTQEMEED